MSETSLCSSAKKRAKKRLEGATHCCASGSPLSSMHLPVIKCIVDNKLVNVLIDSGCSRSIISRKIVAGKQLSEIRERVITMNGDEVMCTHSIALEIFVDGVALKLNFLVADIIPEYQILLGMDAICKLGGVYINEGSILFGTSVSAIAINDNSCEKELSAEDDTFRIDDIDFTAEFANGKWVVRWFYFEEPKLNNRVSQYKVPEEIEEEYCKELDGWIKDGWLRRYDGDFKGVIPLMAVVQKNKSKVRPVMDFRQLNESVSNHTAESSVCGEKLRNWRRMGSNLSVIDLKKAYLQIHVHPDLWKHQIVVYKGKTFCLTRLGFGLSVAPKIMTKILTTVLSSNMAVSKGTDSYIDDIIVNNDVVENDTVLAVLQRFGLTAKPPEKLLGTRVLGLRISEGDGKTIWSRDNNICEVEEPITKRKIFSWCGQIIGHYPVCNWLRPACSYLKRISGKGGWDDEVSEEVVEIFRDLQNRVIRNDPVKGTWPVKDCDSGVVWVDASSLAVGAVVQIDEDVIEDGCWLRKVDDATHINLAELDGILKGLNMAINWKLRTIYMKTDSKAVYSWLTSILTGDKRIKTKGISEILVRRRLSLIKDIVRECELTLQVDWICTNENLADSLTRVPQKWLKRNQVCCTIVEEKSRLSESTITELHNEHHFGIEKTCYFIKKHFPDETIDKQQVRDVISKCERCLSVDPTSIQWDEGHLSVENVWDRIAIDVTHFESERFLTVIDCGPSRFSIWRKVTSEASQVLTAELDQIFKEFGPPSEILLDNSTSFRSSDFKELCSFWKINLLYRCAYRPSGNGIVERNHRTIKRMSARSGKNILSMVRMYNLAPTSSGKAPSEHLFQRRWRYPLMYKQDEFFENRNFFVGQKVFVKPANAKCFTKWPIGTVTRVSSEWSIEIDGYPRHVSDIRVHPSFCNCVEENKCVPKDKTEKMNQSTRTVEFVDLHDTEIVNSSSTITDDESVSGLGSNFVDNNEIVADESTTRPVRERHRPRKYEDYVT